MAGVSLLALKRRLKSITGTRKITMAMGMVSTSKYQKARRLLSANDVHFNEFSRIAKIILAKAEIEEDETEWTPKVKVKSKPVYLVINSNKGMAGAFNSSLMARLKEELGKEPLAQIIFTGQRGTTDIRRSVPADRWSIVPMGDLPQEEMLTPLVKKALEMYKKGEVTQIRVLYTRYLSPLQEVIQVDTLLPLQPDALSKEGADEEASFERYLFEPSASSMKEHILDMYVQQKMYNVMLHGKTSEHSVRMRTMEAANRNADELLLMLNKQYNRIRQGAITQEITEIVSGAEALK